MEEEEWNGDLAIGITAAIGVLWWLVWDLFVYIKTNTSDYTMQYYDYTSNTLTEGLPIGWFWGNLNHPTMGWTAATYLTVFFGYFIVSFIELIGWILWLVESEERGTGSWFFNMWASYVGLYGSWILYFLTVLFPILQLAQINGDIFLPGWINGIVQLTVFTLFWLASGLVHLFMVPYLNYEYDNATGGAKAIDCNCERHLADADEAPEINAKNLLTKLSSCSAKLQNKQCGPEIVQHMNEICTVERASLNQVEYNKACADQYTGRCDLPRADGETEWNYIKKCEVRRRVGGGSKAQVPDATDVNEVVKVIEEAEPDTGADW